MADNPAGAPPADPAGTPLGEPPEPPAAPEPPAPSATDSDDNLQAAGKAALENERKARRDAERKAKALEAQVQQLQRQTMDENQRAVAEARDAGKAEALTEVGAKLVAAEFKMKAAGRLADAQLTTLIEGTNLPSFMTDTGDVDAAKVEAFIAGIAGPTGGKGTEPDDDAGQSWVPVKGTAGFPDIGQGQRGTPPALNDDPLLKALVNKVGTRQ